MRESFFERYKSFVTYFVVVILIVFSMFMIRQIFSEYFSSSKSNSECPSKSNLDKEITNLNHQFLICNANLTSLNYFNENLISSLETYSNEVVSCKIQLNEIEFIFNDSKNNYEAEIKSLNDVILSKSAEIELLQSEKNAELLRLKIQLDDEISNLSWRYNILAQITANNLCCKAKIDNPKISFYKVNNDKVVCLEEQGIRISC